MKRGIWLAVFFILLLSGSSVAVGIYDSIPIQIQTLNDAGVATTGTFTFKIDISNSSTCSPVLYTNTTTLTTDSRGIVSYNLLDVDLSFDEQYWFCYYRDGVLKSTIKAARVPYAFNAKNTTLSGVEVDTNFDLGSYNVTADYFIGDGSQLTGVALSGADSLWTNVSNVATYVGNVNVTEGVYINGYFINSSNYINPIVESGNNSNGYYVKYIDGTMMAWGITSVTTYPQTITFPVNFSDNSYKFIPSWTSTGTYTANTVSNEVPVTSVESSHLISYTKVWVNTGTTAGQVTSGSLNWYAIGKWTNTPYNTSTITVGGGIPAGAIVAYNRTSCPVGWILADGSNGTPDLRGIFIRGSGTNSILKYANGSYFSATQGSYANDSFQGHKHASPSWAVYNGDGAYNPNPMGYGSSGPYGNTLNTALIISDGISGTPRNSSETSPAYYSTIYCVKTTEDSATSNSIWTTIGDEVRLNNASNILNVTTNISTPLLCLNGNCQSSFGGESLWTNVSNTATYLNSVNISGSLNVQNSSGDLILYVNDSSGRVGIQRENPAFELDVNGSVRATTYYGDGSQLTGVQTTASGVPAGAIVAYNRTSCPVGWVLADGNSGTPDLRGIFIRGSGTNSILKYANGTAFAGTLGTYQNDSFQGHYHEGISVYGGSTSVIYDIGAGNTGFPVASSVINSGTTGMNNAVLSPKSAGDSTGIPRTGSETTPAYYSTIYCVKTTEDTATSNSIWATSGNNVLLNNASMNVNIQNTKVRATKTTAQTFSSSVGATVLFNSETYDTLGEYNTSNGRFTATQSGYYLVNAFIFFDIGYWGAGQQINFDLVKNGVGYDVLYHHLFEGTLNNKYFSAQGSTMIYLNAGDFITIVLIQYTGGDKTIYADGYYNYFEVTRIP